MFATTQTQKTTLSIYLYIAICTFVWTFCMSWITNIFALDCFSADQQIYGTIGQGLLNGKELYTDLWDHKGPLIFIWYALGYAISPDSKLGLLILFYLIQFVSLLYVFKLSSLFLERWLALLMPLVVPVFLFGTSIMYPSDIVLSLQLVTLYLFLTRKNNDIHHLSRMFLFGLFSWITVFLKFNLAPFWIPFLICETLETLFSKGIKECSKSLAVYILSLILILSSIIPFTQLSAIWDNYFIFNIKYAVDGISQLIAPSEAFLHGFLQPWYLISAFYATGIPTFMATIIGILSFTLFAFLWPYKKTNKWTSACILTSCIINFISIFGGCNYIFFYFINLLPFYLLTWILVLKTTTRCSAAIKLNSKLQSGIRVGIYLFFVCCFIGFALLNIKKSLPYAEQDRALSESVNETLQGEKDALLLGMIGVYPALRITPPIPHFFQPLISTEKFNKHREQSLQIIRDRGVKNLVSADPIDEELAATLSQANYKQVHRNHLYHYVRCNNSLNQKK